MCHHIYSSHVPPYFAAYLHSSLRVSIPSSPALQFFAYLRHSLNCIILHFLLPPILKPIRPSPTPLCLLETLPSVHPSLHPSYPSPNSYPHSVHNYTLPVYFHQSPCRPEFAVVLRREGSKVKGQRSEVRGERPTQVYSIGAGWTLRALDDGRCTRRRRQRRRSRRFTFIIIVVVIIITSSLSYPSSSQSSSSSSSPY